MQQLIQQRNTTWQLLNRAKTLYNTWADIQAKSLSTLQSICNIVAQRKSTLELPKTIERYNIDQDKLLFKQTDSISSLIEKQKVLLGLYEDVCLRWSELTRDIDKFVTKVLQQQHTTTPLPLSTESMLQVAAVDVSDLYEMVSLLDYSYNQEYIYKISLFGQIQSSLSEPTDAYHLLELWQEESHVDKKTLEDMFERMKMFTTIKKVLESVD
ncbi:hypothetical protein G6F70_005320 [Rhizopus microsporus]|uniref:Uncharacterized protein n=2 Tax=Rhizopus TaxID=4842 RepID=A0A367JVN2_RHIAZ|nr:hypothetical protein G6F71_005215 [Rhizopus microsporus]RCH93957.1 hypothetical protein CU097_013213 [Rhizopus azygosporus]KAG1198989.1 hypothetical protein G6F70_005320 [Rhizopus microsporus]KAG1210751.1 hypothetical protein G6F69_005204 [Rhizopus microsporus]KAG1232571.1 hypothetical protein G6F67_004918 [Rhizopus microsporus]